MFTIEYTNVNGESKTQAFDSRDRTKLAVHLSRFSLPIVAVYEQASPITKAMRAVLGSMPHHKMTRHALSFVASRAP